MTVFLNLLHNKLLHTRKKTLKLRYFLQKGTYIEIATIQKYLCTEEISLDRLNNLEHAYRK